MYTINEKTVNLTLLLKNKNVYEKRRHTEREAE